MSVVATALRELMALGVTGEALAAAVERIEEAATVERTASLAEAVQLASAKADRELTTRQARNARYYEAKRLKASESKTIKTPQDDTKTIKTLSDAERLASCAGSNSTLPSLRSEEVRTPTEPNGSVAPKGAKTRIPKSRICPADWSPSDEDRAVGAAEGFTAGEIERELAKFRDHEFRDPHSHWSPTFRKWLRTAADRKPRLIHERSHPDKRTAAFVERLGDIDAAMAAAVQQRGGSG